MYLSQFVYSLIDIYLHCFHIAVSNDVGYGYLYASFQSYLSLKLQNPITGSKKETEELAKKTKL